MLIFIVPSIALEVVLFKTGCMKTQISNESIFCILACISYASAAAEGPEAQPKVTFWLNINFTIKSNIFRITFWLHADFANFAVEGYIRRTQFWRKLMQHNFFMHVFRFVLFLKLISKWELLTVLAPTLIRSGSLE